MEDAEIDLRTMSENYEHGVIPSVDVAAAINAVLGDPFTPGDSIDPRKDKALPKFAWVPNTETAIQPKFQRDVSPNHTYKIEMNFDDDVKEGQKGLRRAVHYKFPEKFVRTGEIELSQEPVIAEFKLIPLPSVEGE